MSVSEYGEVDWVTAKMQTSVAVANYDVYF